MSKTTDQIIKQQNELTLEEAVRPYMEAVNKFIKKLRKVKI